MTLHVDADALAAGDGLTWGTAFDDLQAALAEAGTRNTDGDGANDVDAIWIAEGTYRPSALLEDGDDRSASFSLVDGVTLYGGFVGDETTLEERDWATYVTTLSGDLGTVDDDSDNAYTVVYCGESVEGGVDGVSIVDGNADYTSGYDRPERYQGGGIFNYGGTLTVSNSAISGNSASFYGGGVSGSGEFEFSDSVLSGNSAARTGGAIYIDTGTLTVTDSSILGNSAESGGGIGEYNAVLIAANCTLSENSADDGAGVYIHFGNLTVTGCTLSENSATSGGGIYSHSGSSLTVSDSSLTDNWGAYGGGICSWGTLTVTSSALTGNSANYGGGIYSGNYALTVTDSTLSGNSANTRGGGIYNRHSTMAVTNSRFLENSAWEGGAINNANDTLTISNSSFGGNSAESKGGGIFNDEGTVTVTNSTLSGNSANDGGGIYDNRTLTLANAIVCLNSGRDIIGSLLSSRSLISVDPGFVRAPSAGVDGEWGTDDDDFGDLHLADRSAAVNGGDNALAVDADGNPLTTDLEGNPRIADDAVDIGAYEFQGPPATGRETPSLVVSVAHDEFDLYDGEVTLREAIYYSESGQAVGTVVFDPALDGGTITLAGWELFISQSIVIDATALSAFTVDADNRSGVMSIIDEVTLAGLTITNGSASYGGGVFNSGTLTMANCTVLGNSSDADGAIYSTGTLIVTDSTLSGNTADGIISNGTLTVEDCILSENTGSGISSDGTLTVTSSIVSQNGNGGIASSGTLTVTDSTISENSGSGIRIHDGTIAITGCTITGNMTTSEGGAIWNYGGALEITDSTISNNLAGGEGGGGIYNRQGTLTVTNSTFLGNQTTNGGGGGIKNYEGTLIITNCAFLENSVTGSYAAGGAIWHHGYSDLALANAVLCGNSADTGGAIYIGCHTGSFFGDFGTVTITNSSISGNAAEYCGGIYNNLGSTVMLANSIAYLNAGSDIVGSFHASTSLISANAGFVRAPSAGTDGEWGTDDDDLGDLRLADTSPAINAGSDMLATDIEGYSLSTDLDGNPRIVDAGLISARTNTKALQLPVGRHLH